MILVMDLIYNLIHQGVSAIIPFILLLSVLIFVHELGHFLVAKYFGVRVEVFSLGFGKKILQFKRGDTVYCISIIPLGGYVKMFGDDISAQISDEEKKFSFTHKPVFQRIGVVLAGPMMNFFFAILLFFAISLIGEEVRGPFAGDISEESVAYKAGFRSGDKILKVNDVSINTFEDFQKQLNLTANKVTSFEVQREAIGSTPSTTEKITATPNLKPNPNILSMDDYAGEISGLEPLSKATVVGILTNSPAEKSGFKTGDTILKINEQDARYLRSFKEVALQQLKTNPQNLNFSILRISADGKKTTPQEISIPLAGINLGENSLETLGFDLSETYISKSIEGTPAFLAGIAEGDKIVGIDDKAPKSWEDILNTIKSYSGSNPLKIQIQRGTENKTFEVLPKMTTQTSPLGTEETRYTVGIVPMMQQTFPQTVFIKTSDPIFAITKGFKKTVDVSVMTVISFLKLLQNKISPKSIGGVLSIGQIASESFKLGISQFLQIMAVISINLFVLNLLPIPVLDGGHLLFYSVEALRGSPVSMRKMEIAQQIGLILLMSLMVFALFNDFSRIFNSL